MVFVLCRWVTIVFFLLTLTGCHPATLRTQAAQGSQLVLSTLQDPKTFNPALNQEFPNIFLFTAQGLTSKNGVTGAVEPALAESWEISEDKLKIRFTLREGLKWSDGTPLTAADVVFTYQDVIFNPAIPTDLKDGLRIGAKGTFPSVIQLDLRRVEFSLPEPFAPFLRATAGPDGVTILPKHILEQSIHTKGDDGNLQFISLWGTSTSPQDLVVNGPYQIEQYVSGERILFRRNPYYWRQDTQGQPLPYIDRIFWKIVESTDTQLLKFRSGDLDVIGDVRPLRPEYFSLLKREEQRGKFRIENGGAWSGTTYLTFNLNRAKNQKGKPLVEPTKSRWFNTLEFRQAVAYAIDRPRMNNNVLRGIGTLQDSPISVQSPFYLSAQNGLKTYTYNPAEAKALLLKAGFIYNAQGQLLDSEGNRVRFTLLTNAGNKNREAMGAQIKQDLAQIGMQVDFNAINFSTLVDKINGSRDWDAHIIGFTGGVEPNSTANLWTSQGGSHSFNLATQPGQPPIVGWEPLDWEREIDRLFIAGAKELDEAKRQIIYGDFQKIVQEKLPVIHLVNEVALAAVRDRVQGLKYSGLPSWGLWNIEELKLRE